MKNIENTTVPAGYSRSALIEALRDVARQRHNLLVVHPLGWFAVPPSFIDVTEELPLLDYEGLLEATPNESPEEYTEETYEGLAEWAEENVQGWVRLASEQAEEDTSRAYLASFLPKTALRTILANLKRA
jgi:hypothetical protein